MLKYKDLTKAQRRVIDTYLEHYPDLAKKDTITFHEINRIHVDLYKRRSEGVERVGYPNWIFKNNKIERGVYWFPSPNAGRVPRTKKVPTVEKIQEAKKEAALANGNGKHEKPTVEKEVKARKPRATAKKAAPKKEKATQE